MSKLFLSSEVISQMIHTRQGYYSADTIHHLEQMQAKRIHIAKQRDFSQAEWSKLIDQTIRLNNILLKYGREEEL